MKKQIEIHTDKLFTNITEQVQEFATDWGKSGIVNVFSPHTTMSIWLTEDEVLHHADVRFSGCSSADNQITRRATQEHQIYARHDFFEVGC